MLSHCLLVATLFLIIIEWNANGNITMTFSFDLPLLYFKLYLLRAMYFIFTIVLKSSHCKYSFRFLVNCVGLLPRGLIILQQCFIFPFLASRSARGATCHYFVEKGIVEPLTCTCICILSRSVDYEFIAKRIRVIYNI